MTEPKTFYIADYQIDLSRSMIRKGQNDKQIEPKVLKVLLLLAKRQNQVVTHKEIMDEVWQGTEVVPNALQRCIAILRKALNDDARSPTFIATHKKIGYSLIADVRWTQGNVPQTNDSNQTEPLLLAATDTPTYSLSSLILTGLLFVAGVIALLFISPFGPAPLEPALSGQSPKSALMHKTSVTEFPKQFSQIELLTHTDAHESNAIYSPDAKHIIFNRYAGSCKNHLWARNLKSGQEFQLTAAAAQFGEVSFTNDGRELVFAANKQCLLDSAKTNKALIDIEKKHPIQTCWHLATLDFSRALISPQTPDYRHQCQAEKLKIPTALRNHQYVFLQYQAGQNQLMHYNDLTKEISHFYNPDPQDIYHFDYDALNKRFAVFARDHNYKTILTLLNHSGQVLQQNKIEHQSDMAGVPDIKGNFEPQGSFLLATINNQLYTLTLGGKLTQIKTPTRDLVSVVKHPFKQSLLAVKGNKDIDIARINIDSSNINIARISIPSSNIDEKPLPQNTNDSNSINDLNNIKAPYKSLARSSAQEQMARYQPNGNRLAFISDRSGTNQLWLWYKGKTKQLSFETSVTGIQNFSWSPDGTRLAWSSGSSVAITDLEGKINPIPISTNNNKTIDAVTTWYSENELLMVLHDPYPGGLYKLHLPTQQLTALGINHVEAAWVTQTQGQDLTGYRGKYRQIIYKQTEKGVFIRPLETTFDEEHAANEDNNITNIGQRLQLNSKALFVANGFIYGVDKTSLMLNQYNLKGELLKPIMQMENNAWQITDIKNNDTYGPDIKEQVQIKSTLLVSQFIAINQEIVVLQ